MTTLLVADILPGLPLGGEIREIVADDGSWLSSIAMEPNTDFTVI